METEEIIIRVAVSHDEEGCNYYIYDGEEACEAGISVDGGFTDSSMESAVAMAAEHAIEILKGRA